MAHGSHQLSRAQQGLKELSFKHCDNFVSTLAASKVLSKCQQRHAHRFEKKIKKMKTENSCTVEFRPSSPLFSQDKAMIWKFSFTNARYAIWNVETWNEMLILSQGIKNGLQSARRCFAPYMRLTIDLFFARLPLSLLFGCLAMVWL